MSGKPVGEVQFWRKRLLWACATGRGTHTAIYDTSPDTWQDIQNCTKKILSNHLSPGDKLLDAGCGYGAASSYLPGDGVKYVGVDFSPEMIEVARLAYPDRDFRVGDLRRLEFSRRYFDFALCRSIRKMVVDEMGAAEWKAIERELLRVSRRIIIIEYEDLPRYVLLPGEEQMEG